jgi:hypothetical protein
LLDHGAPDPALAPPAVVFMMSVDNDLRAGEGTDRAGGDLLCARDTATMPAKVTNKRVKDAALGRDVNRMACVGTGATVCCTINTSGEDPALLLSCFSAASRHAGTRFGSQFSHAAGTRHFNQT